MEDPTKQLAEAAMEKMFEKTLRGLDIAAGWIKKGRAVRRAAKEYTDRLRESCDKMRVLSMREPVPLTNIYTRVNILEKITRREWKKLEELESSFDPHTRSFGTIKGQAKPGIQVVNELQKFILLGKPGSGKTTFLKYVALQALDGKLAEGLIPVFISLKELTDSGSSLMDFIAKEFHICEFPDPMLYVQQILKAGGCILLLDGLDEVGKEKNERVIQDIKDVSHVYRNNRFIVSCRIAAYNQWFQDFTDVELADFTDDQIRRFIDKWFGEDSKKAELCWSQLHENEPIKELASIPLLLTLFCIAFDRNMELPRSKAELYEDAVVALLREWDGSRSIKRDQIYQNLSAKRKVSMFSRIAGETFEKGQFFLPHRLLESHISRFIQNLPDADQDSLGLDSEAVLKAVEAQHGIFVERAKGIYSFSHLTIQEYFTARYIVDNAKSGTLEALVENHLTNERWQEVFIITTGMLDQADDFLLAMKRQIDGLITDKRLAEFLNKIQAAAQEANLPWSSSTARAAIVFLTVFRDYHRVRALDLNHVCARDRALERTRALDLALDVNLAIDRALTLAFALDPTDLAAIDLALDLDLALDFPLAFGLVRDLVTHLRANELLVDCLNTECYISRATRQRILDELLIAPDSTPEGGGYV